MRKKPGFLSFDHPAILLAKVIMQLLKLLVVGLWVEVEVTGRYPKNQCEVVLRLAYRLFFFFKQKTAYEIGLGIPAEPLFRSKRKSKHSAMLRNKETRHRMFIGLLNTTRKLA